MATTPDMEKHTEKPTDSFHEYTSRSTSPEPVVKHTIDPTVENVNAKLANPLAGIPRDQLMRDGAHFARHYGLGHLEKQFSKGALVAQDPDGFETLDILSEKEREVLRREATHQWSQPFTLYWLVVMCSVCAAVQGNVHRFVESTALDLITRIV
jgi:hypothetical protein